MPNTQRGERHSYFFINGVRHDGAYDLETLLTAIADAAG
jgi:hypothetical protein